MATRSAPLIPQRGALVRSLASGEFNRLPPIATSGRFKQRVHATISTPEVTLVANFSSTYTDFEPAHRLTTLMFGESVQGHVRAPTPEACLVAPGRSAIRIGDSYIAPTKTGFKLVVVEPARQLSAELVLEARSSTSALYNMRLGREDVLHWSVVPRLIANGTITHAGRTYAVVDAPAYRDRSWGVARFGQVAWDWGYALSDDLANPIAVVFARLMDASRTQLLQQEVLVWSGLGLLSSFGGAEVELSSSGRARGPFPTVPAALALCRPGHASDVPERLVGVARSARGELRLEFERAATARIIAPNDEGVGTTASFASLGRIRVTGRVEGHAIELAGRGFLESVHA